MAFVMLDTVFIIELRRVAVYLKDLSTRFKRPISCDKVSGLHKGNSKYGER